MSEIELKLHGTPANLKAVFTRLARKAAKGTAFTKSLRAVYFDTAKDDLHAKGLSLRVREENGRFIQTLKRSEGGDVLTRGEWSDDVAGTVPELLTTKSGRKLKQVWKDVRLLPRFRTEINRHGLLLRPQRGAEVEVVRDAGEIHAIGREERPVRISEVELELKKGTPAVIYRLALEILAHKPVQIEPRAKADRGYALHSPGARIDAVKAEALAIHRDETLAETLRRAARHHFAQFLANIAGASKHDPSSIHQMRVAMRRLRASLYAVRGLLPEAEYENVRSKLKYLLQSLGPARDWEVLCERISELEDDEDLKGRASSLKNAVTDEKRRALGSATETIGSPKNTKAVLESLLWFEELPTARHGRKLKVRADIAASRILDDLFTKVGRRGRHFAKQSIDDRHRLRIACKNLRYNIELFGPIFGVRKAARFLDRLKPVQDDLGHLNDVSRARDLLSELAGRSPQKAAAEAVVAKLESRVAATNKRARTHVARLRNTQGFW